MESVQCYTEHRGDRYNQQDGAEAAARAPSCNSRDFLTCGSRGPAAEIL